MAADRTARTRDNQRETDRAEAVVAVIHELSETKPATSAQAERDAAYSGGCQHPAAYSAITAKNTWPA
jgi:hypothetical protein